MLCSARFKCPVVFFANGIGDSLLVLPALRALAHIFPNQLIMVCKEGARRTFFSEIAFRKVIEVDFKCKTGKFEFCYSEVAQVIGKCDLFISLVPWRSESLN